MRFYYFIYGTKLNSFKFVVLCLVRIETSLVQLKISTKPTNKKTYLKLIFLCFVLIVTVKSRHLVLLYRHRNPSSKIWRHTKKKSSSTSSCYYPRMPTISVGRDRLFDALGELYSNSILLLLLLSFSS